MKIGFCTSVMNRRWQLERTLAVNLGKLRGTGSFLALCDYNSRDGVEDLVRDHAADIAAGTLLFFRTDQPVGFHACKAKNLAHRLALLRAPDALFNLDCDNFLSTGTLDMVAEVLAGEPEASLHNWTTASGDGTCGRIGMRAQTWMNLGGYDEALGPTAFQDLELLIRCRAAGLRYVLRRDEIPPPVPNSLAMKLQHLADHNVRARGRANPDDRFNPQGRGDDDSPSAHYQRLHINNIVTSLGRPCRLPMAEQQRWQGMLNFDTAMTI